MRLAINGEPAAVGAGFACLGNLLNSVTWLADAMCERGMPLRAGQCIMAGSFGPMRPVRVDDALRAGSTAWAWCPRACRSSCGCLSDRDERSRLLAGVGRLAQTRRAGG